MAHVHLERLIVVLESMGRGAAWRAAIHVVENVLL